MMAALAAETSTIRLSTNVTQIPLRNPGVLAHQAVTVDHISGGRVELGIGTGLTIDPGTEMIGLPNWSNGERASRFGEYVELLGLLLSDEVTTYEGEYYRADQAVMNPSAMDPDGKLPFKDKVEKLIFFTRLHLLPFSVSEDDEKMTFMPDPCPSGARLIQQGHYQSPRNAALVVEQGPLTYQQKDFPIYCCHEPAMEISSLKATGVPVFIVDPSDQLGVTPCKVYVYKRVSEIPEAYFTRLGLRRPEDLLARSR